MTDSTDIKWNFSSYTDKKGRTYIISYYNKWDSVKKQSRVAKRIHVGRLNTDNGKVSLGKTYLEQHPEYIDCSVFYEDSFMRGFLAELYNRPSCHNCHFKNVDPGWLL